MKKLNCSEINKTKKYIAYKRFYKIFIFKINEHSFKQFNRYSKIERNEYLIQIENELEHSQFVLFWFKQYSKAFLDKNSDELLY